jgi:hypothetical protein
MGAGKTKGRQGETRTERAITDESELGSDIQGNNKQQGNDQKKRPQRTRDRGRRNPLVLAKSPTLRGTKPAALLSLLKRPRAQGGQRGWRRSAGSSALAPTQIETASQRRAP